MYKDIYGKTRQKLGLHIHTTMSDGTKTPEESARIYKDAGYDAIAFTDHWNYQNGGELEGIRIISGAEFNIGGNNTPNGVYHMVGLFTEIDPEAQKSDPAATIVDKIHKAGGIAVLAHPAWSLNTPELIEDAGDFDATEIYNSVSAVGESFRADSSLLVDMMAARGKDYLLLATDDAHFYSGKDNCVSYIMVECETNDSNALKNAILEKKFYATQGPEIHIFKDRDRFCVQTSPVEHIYFATQAAWCHRSKHGKGITEAEYMPNDFDTYVRAFAVDAEGRTAWSNIIRIK